MMFMQHPDLTSLSWNVNIQGFQAQSLC